MNRAASEAFGKDLMVFLQSHPYWAKAIATGSRADRRRLASQVAKALTTIPRVGEGVTR